MIFAVFDPSLHIVDKLQYLVFIFAVSLPVTVNFILQIFRIFRKVNVIYFIFKRMAFIILDLIEQFFEILLFCFQGGSCPIFDFGNC